MNQEQLIPYKNINTTWNEETSLLQLSLPWISLKIKLDSTYKTPFNENGTLSHQILNGLAKFPLTRVAPRNNFSIENKLYVEKTSLNNLAPNEIFKKLDINYQLQNNTWIWDHISILESIKINEDSYDPLSLYGLLTEMRLFEEHEANLSLNFFKKLNELLEINDETFIKAISFILEQTYYITNHCIESLMPAISSYLPASNLVSDFIKEEMNHDRLVLKSLKVLSPSSPRIEKVTVETKTLMSLLKKSAESYFLGFSCIIGSFEGIGYSAEDPLAVLLKKSSKPEAAIGIQQHYMINKNGNHSAVGEGFIRTLPAIDKNTALNAIYLTELITRVRISFSKKIYEAVQNELN